MSDQAVRAAIAQMEAWMADPTWKPDSARLAQWNTDFQAAMAQAEKGQDWAELMDRAHVVGRLLDVRTGVMEHLRDSIQASLNAKALGSRALKGYRANTR